MTRKARSDDPPKSKSRAGNRSRAAEDDAGWIGQQCMPKSEDVSVVDDDGIPSLHLKVPFKVSQVDGDRLGIGWGWVRKDEVVLLDRAEKYFTACLRKNPDSSWFYLSRGCVRVTQGDLDKAIEDYGAAMQHDPQCAEIYFNRGSLLGDQQKFEQAIPDFDEAIRLDKQFAPAYFQRGYARMETGDLDKAIKDFNKAIRLNSRYAVAYCSRGMAWKRKCEFDKALRDFDRTIRIDPRCLSAYYYRGQIWRIKEDFERALQDDSEAIRLDPENSFLYSVRAWLRATTPDSRFRDGAQAVADALKACELAASKPGARATAEETLAAAYAEAGEFKQAVKWQASAIKLLKKAQAGTTKLDAARERLGLYKAGKPYRDRAR